MKTEESPLKVPTRNPPAYEHEKSKISMQSRFLWLVLLVGGGHVFWMSFTHPAYRGYVDMAFVLPCWYFLIRLGDKAKKLDEPIPLTSWVSSFGTQGHVVEMAFQVPAEFNTPEVRERVQIAARAILRKLKAHGLQDALEEGLAGEVFEMKIPVFRIQILAIKNVVVTVFKTPEKDPSLYI